jgi:hypothetical protein
MAVSDAIIGTYDYRIMLAVYLAMAFPLLLRGFLVERLTAVRVVLCATASSVVFFLATNLAVWAFSGMYERTMAGLAKSYLAGLPFFKFTLSGDLCWTVGLFGTYALVGAVRHRSLPRLVHGLRLSWKPLTFK